MDLKFAIEHLMNNLKLNCRCIMKQLYQDGNFDISYKNDVPPPRMTTVKYMYVYS